MSNKYFGLVLVLLLTLSAKGQQIIVSDNLLTVQQLVQNVLVNGTCAQTSNWTSVTGTNYAPSPHKGIGYFQKNNSNFPFDRGIILSTGKAKSAPGPNNAMLSEGNEEQGSVGSGVYFWRGDDQLDLLVPSDKTHNRSVIEFDFIPPTNKVKFRYLLASEEYEAPYPCNGTDVFAFILSGPGINNSNAYNHDADPATPDVTIDLGGKNIALLPGTNIPVSIHNTHNLSSCGTGQLGSVSQPAFYDTALSGNGATNFNGQTIPLTAEADVIAGQTYHLKLVIADFKNAVHDSAIFIEANSFDLGMELDVTGLDITNGVASACAGESITINGTVSVPNTTYQWYKDDVLLPGETNPTFTTTTSGVYKLRVTIPIAGQAPCIDEETITIELIDVPTANTPPDLRMCDTGADGIENFTLTTNDSAILGGQNPANYNISYHASQSDAENDANPLSSPYTNTSNNQIIYARIDSNANSECKAITSFKLILDDSPTATQPANPHIRQCDVGDDYQETFNLTQFQSTILGSQSLTNVAISYHTSLNDAENDLNPIGIPSAYITYNATEVIYVRVDYHNNSNCIATTSFTIHRDKIPVAATPPDLRSCDVNNNGTAIFDLTQNNTSLLHTQSPDDFEVTYHLTAAAATAGTNAIANPTTYQSTVPTDIIYARIQNKNNPACADATKQFNIIIDPVYFAAAAPQNLISCDDATNNGFENFNIAQQTPIIMGSLSPSVATLTYHTAVDDANAGINAIPAASLNAYSSTSTVIHYRLESVMNSNCYSTGSFQLIVNSRPVFANTNIALKQCYDYTANGFAPFNLTAQNNSFTGGNTNYTVSYHLTSNDAENDVNALTSPYTNIANPQNIHVRLEDNTTNCYSLTTLTLEVLPDITAITPPPLKECDEDNDGIADFDLSNLATVLTGNVPTAIVHYYQNLDQAQANDPTIIVEGSSPAIMGTINPAEVYQNIQEDNQTIYARVAMAPPPSQCFSIVPIQLEVIRSPILPNQEPYTVSLCDNYQDTSDDTLVYNLNSLLPEMLANITGTAADYTVSFYTSDTDAQAPQNPIINITGYTLTPTGTPPTVPPVWIRVEHNTTRCVSIKKINFEVNNPPVVQDYIYELCDGEYWENMDEFQIFDLDSRIDNITTDASVTAISFHLTNADAEAGNNAITNTNAFSNTVNPQTLHVRVEGTDGCFAIAQLNLKVNPNPTPLKPVQIATTLGDITSCTNDPAHTNPAPGGSLQQGYAQFDLNAYETTIHSGEPDVNVSYFTDINDARLNINAIPTAHEDVFYNTVPFEQTIYVRVEKQGTGCYTITSFVIKVPTPEIEIEGNTVLCVDDNGVPLSAHPPLVLTAKPGPDAANLYTYQWALNGTDIPGATEQNYTVIEPGNYTVTITSVGDTECKNSAQATVTISASPNTINANVSTNAFDSPAQIIVNVTSNITPNAVYEYSLDDLNYTTNNIFNDVKPGINEVYIRDQSGCATKKIPVLVVDYPRFFSPNGDGVNDTWNIIGIGNIPISQIYIFNRYGKLVKQIDPDTNGWDGTYNGSPMPADDYWFKIIYLEGEVQKEYKAHFSLKR